MNGLQNILGGIIAFGFSFIPSSSPLASWKALFLSYGVITVFWGVFVGFWMPDSPMRARCWSEDDKRLMIERVRENQTGLQNKTFRAEQVWEAFRDPQCTPTNPTQPNLTLTLTLLPNFNTTTITTIRLTMQYTPSPSSPSAPQSPPAGSAPTPTSSSSPLATARARPSF